MATPETYRIEWRIAADEFSELDFSEVKQDLEEEHGEHIEEIVGRKPLAISGIATALTIIAASTGSVASLVTILDYLSEEDETVEIVVVVPAAEGEVDIEAITGVDTEIQVEQREPGEEQASDDEETSNDKQVPDDNQTPGDDSNE